MKTLDRRTRSLIALVAVSALFAIGATYVVPVPAATAVSAHFTESISSSGASAGQTLQIVAAQPLIVQGWLVAVKGAVGQAHVVSVTPASKGKAAIAVQFDWITAVDGQHLPLVAGKDKDKDKPLIFGAGGPFAESAPKGKDVSVGPDFAFTAYVATDRPVTISAGG